MKKENQPNSELRICICTDLWLGSHNGGVERIVRFAENVSKQGVKVYLVDRSRKKSLSALALDDDKYYKVENGQITEHSYPFHVRFVLPGAIKFVQEAIDHWISQMTQTTVSEVSYSYFVDPYLFIKMFFVCKTERIDLIQCEFPFTTFPSWIVREITGIPLVYDAHNIESERIKTMANVNRLHSNIMKKLEIKSCNICDSVFVVSKRDRARLKSWGIPESKVTVIPNSADLAKFSPEIDGEKIRKRYGLDNAFLIIFHGALNYPPNLEAVQILVSILPRLLEKYPNVYLLLVGKDPPKISSPHVIVTGFVENPVEYIAAADLAVVPLASGGGTKLKMLDYMACGKAIVSTMAAAEGLDLENEKDALITQLPDSEFTRLVMRAIADADLRKRIGENARRKVKQLYDWEKNATKAINVYRSMVSRHS